MNKSLGARLQGIVGDEANRRRAEVRNSDLLTLYRRLKKGDTFTASFHRVLKAEVRREFVVTSPHREVGKAKVGRIILSDADNPTGCKYYLYNRRGKVTMSHGDMSVSPWYPEGIEIHPTHTEQPTEKQSV